MRAWGISGWAISGLISLTILFSGCARRDDQRATIEVSGVVRLSSGEPVSGVRLVLVAAEGEEDRSVFGFDLDKDGSFQGEVFPGIYAYYLATLEVEMDHDDSKPANEQEAKKLRAFQQVLQSFPASFRTPKAIPPDHRVQVALGKPIQVTVKK
jgi:hypothetical protein